MWSASEEKLNAPFTATPLVREHVKVFCDEKVTTKFPNMSLPPSLVWHLSSALGSDFNADQLGTSRNPAFSMRGMTAMAGAG